MSVATFGFAVLLAPALVGAEDATVEVRFAEDVVPLMRRACFECHAGERVSSGVRLDRRSTVLAEVDPLVVAGEPTKSRLLERVLSRDPDERMPPKGPRLSDEEVDVLRRWIAGGADWDLELLPDAPVRDGVHWSFRPVAEVDVPRIESAWITNPVDAFVLRRLREAQLEPSPPADRRTLLRRLTFDLTGLPPTPEEVRTFLADERPGAYERQVERLLASPAYGERWGRHWLDVVRYADTNGLDENVAHGTAWRYRDWVVSALNTDRPYDAFVREQLAGDLLPTDDDELRRSRLIATGYLSLGPKVLAEVDETKMEMDIVDEQIDTFGKSLLGLTLGCARCHDHKFDAITTADYYALAGIFRSTRTMDSFRKIAKWHEVDVSTPAEVAAREAHAAKVAVQRKEIDKAVARANAALIIAEELEKLPEDPAKRYPAETRERIAELRKELAALETSPPPVRTAMGVAEGDPADVSIHRRGSHLDLGPVVQRGFPVALTDESAPRIDTTDSGRLALAEWVTSPEHPLTARVIVNRVWGWHFGRSLAATPDNLGELGTPPTHPELLDWLAGRFVADSWSLKSLHRLIVTSNTYRQSSRIAATVETTDHENRWLGRGPLRRLEAEEIRDAMLAVTGELDRRAGGSVLNTENRKHVFDHTSRDRTRYDFPRRSLYLPVVRNHLHDPFRLFDYTDASTVNGLRATTTVASQALYLMNSEFVLDRATAFADHLLDQRTDDRDRVSRLYELAYGRPARDSEIAESLTFLRQIAVATTESTPVAASGPSPERRAWEVLCHTVLASSEFLTVR